MTSTQLPASPPFGLHCLRPLAVALVCAGLACSSAWAKTPKKTKKAKATAAATSKAYTEPVMRFTIQPKDTLSQFCEAVLITSKVWPEVAKFNNLKRPNLIVAGQTIDVPLRLVKGGAVGAKVISASGDVSAAAGSSLAEGQQIKVGANSSAVLQMADGSTVKVLPGTLAELVKNRGYNGREADKSIATTWYSGVVRLLQGQVEVLASKAKRAEDFKVIMPTAVVGVRGTVFRAAHVGANSKTEVLEGNVLAQNPRQNSAGPVAAGFGAVIDPAQRDIKAVALLAAPDLAAVAAELPKPDARVSFAPLTGAVSYRIQVARDEGFNDLVLDTAGPSPTTGLGSLANGTWFLRARGVDALGLEGFDRVKKIAIVAPPPPPPPPPPEQVVTAPAPPPPPPPPPPKPNAFAETRLGSLSYSIERGASSLTVEKFEESMRGYEMRVAEDKEFKKFPFAFPVAPVMDLGGMVPGNYFVQFVCKTDCGNTILQSPIYNFEVPKHWSRNVLRRGEPLKLAGN